MNNSCGPSCHSADTTGRKSALVAKASDGVNTCNQSCKLYARFERNCKTNEISSHSDAVLGRLVYQDAYLYRELASLAIKFWMSTQYTTTARASHHLACQNFGSMSQQPIPKGYVNAARQQQVNTTSRCQHICTPVTPGKERSTTAWLVPWHGQRQ